MAKLFVKWTPGSPTSGVPQVVQYKLHTDSAWIDVATVSSFAKNYIINGVLFDTEYDVRIKTTCGSDIIYSPVITVEAEKPGYEFISERLNFNYAFDMTTGLTAGASCAFQRKKEVNLDNSVVVLNNTTNTNLTTIGGATQMFKVPQAGSYRLRARITGSLLVDQIFRDSDFTQLIGFFVNRSSNNAYIPLIANGQTSDDARGINAADYCIPSQYAISKGQAVGVNIAFETTLNLLANEVINYNMVVYLTTHGNQQQGAGETNTTRLNSTLMRLEIKLMD